MAKDITKLFNKFVGQGLQDPMRVTTDIDETLEQMEKVAKDNGLRLRVIFPGAGFDEAMFPDRVTVRVDKSTDSRYKYRIKSFSAG